MRSTQIPALGDGMKLAARAAAAALLTVLALAGIPATSAEPSPATARANSEWTLRGLLRAELEAYLKNRRIPEHISAVSLRATLPGGRYIDVSVGSTRFDGGRPVSAKTLWQIGSNTKAFLSVILLQLEAEGKLSIEDTLDKWLPQYPAWGRITIRQLLNMTSGIPEYLDVPAFRVAYAATPDAIFSATDLGSFAVGLPLLHGWNYSNTNYLLVQIIIENASEGTLAEQLQKRIIAPLGLQDTFYCPEGCRRAVIERIPSSYFFDSAFPEFASLYGKDQHRRNLSYAQGAGAIISSLPDLTTWLRALYEGRMLPPEQQRQLESLVARDSGQPITAPSPEHRLTFGLGLGKALTNVGIVWFYEGETFSQRVMHLFAPDTEIIVAIGTNSLPSEDQLPQLVFKVYELLQDEARRHPGPAP
jgi:D-alanyl-D-alanine carboxypeptidase